MLADVASISILVFEAGYPEVLVLPTNSRARRKVKKVVRARDPARTGQGGSLQADCYCGLPFFLGPAGVSWILPREIRSTSLERATYSPVSFWPSLESRLIPTK